MTLDTRIRRMEEQHSESGERSLAVIVQLGETQEDALTRTLAEANCQVELATFIVVPAKQAIVLDP